MSSEVVSELMREAIVRLAASGRRADGRAPDQVRPLTIRKNYVSTAEGSARVNLGNTDVLVGVKISTGEPYPDTPNSGVLTTSAELIPMASPTFESGPPSPTAIELARVVDRGIRETKTIDLDKLCIVPKEKVWVLFIDMHILDYDGNLFDACSYGTLAALSSAKLPGSKIGAEDRPLPVDHWPVSVTAAKLRDTIVFDPGLDEERIADARLTVATDENGDIRAMQKGLRGSFSYDEIRRVIATARRLGNGLREIIRQ
jgi:exosome complex component RRP42